MILSKKMGGNIIPPAVSSKLGRLARLWHGYEDACARAGLNAAAAVDWLARPADPDFEAPMRQWVEELPPDLRGRIVETLQEARSRRERAADTG